jgi:hypothetical protein
VKFANKMFEYLSAFGVDMDEKDIERRCGLNECFTLRESVAVRVEWNQ